MIVYHNFSYRCGRDGITLPDCPSCGPARRTEEQRDRTPERGRAADQSQRLCVVEHGPG